MPPSPPPSAVSERRWHRAGLGFCVLMLVLHAAAGLNSPGLSDFWRDFYWATAIAHGEAFPLAGPQIYQLFELGPWWFYLLALPVVATGSTAAALAFVQVLGAAKYVLAWRLGTRLAGARYGFAFAACLAIAGWSMVGLMFPSHIAVVETTLLLLAFAVLRAARRLGGVEAVLLGLAATACLHAHPTTVTYVAAAGLYLLRRHRSRAAFGWLCVAALVAAASLLPPWFVRDPAAAASLKPLGAYLGGDVGRHAWTRVPQVAWSILAGGAWWGLLLMTPWKTAAARLGWWLLCAGLLLAAAGLLRARGRADALRRAWPWLIAAFLAQVAFVVLLRPNTPFWMVPSCLPPLAAAIAIGWHAWLDDPRPWLRHAGIAAFALYVLLSLAPFPFWLRDLHATREMPGVNPFFDVIERSERYVNVAVPFYPARRIDRLARQLCAPATLHARLATAIEPTFAAPVRNACGSWPELRYGGVEGRGRHLAGLSPRAAAASGVAPQRVVARMALYERVRPIAPAAGGVAARPRRLQITPDGAAGAVARTAFEFDAGGADAVVLTNRLPLHAPMHVVAVTAAGRPAALRHDDGGARVYGCDGCAAGAAVHWRVEVEAVAGNLDLVVLPHEADAPASG